MWSDGIGTVWHIEVVCSVCTYKGNKNAFVKSVYISSTKEDTMRGKPPVKLIECASIGGREALTFQQENEGTRRDFLCSRFPKGSTQRDKAVET